MSRANSTQPFQVRYRDEIKLLAVFLITLVPAVFVARMLVRAIEDSPLIASVGALVEPLGLSQLVVGTAFVGFFLSLLVLLFLDYQKRVQAFLLILATVGGAAVLWTQLSIDARIGFPEVVSLIGGFVLGLAVIGREKLQYLQLSDTSGRIGGRSIEGRGQEPLTFPYAEIILYYAVGAILVVGFFEAHTSYTQPIDVIDGSITVFPGEEFVFETVDMTPDLITFDVVSSALFFLMMSWFVGYESNRSVFVLGPSGSGKTHLSIAMYLKAQEMGFRPRNTTDKLDRLVQRIIDEQDFIPERTREAQDISFEFTAGKYFPKNVSLDAFDYPGEYLPHIPAGLEVLNEERSQYEYEDTIREQIDEGVAIDQSKNLVGEQSGDTGTAMDGGAEQASAPAAAIDVGDEVIRERTKLMLDEVCPRVQTADLLVFVIDMERFVSDEPLGTEWYSNILSRLPDDQEAIIVATKADLLSSNPANLRGELDRSLREHIGAGRLPIPEKPYPVFYETYEEDGERKMMLRGEGRTPHQRAPPSQQRPVLYGFTEVLNRLGR